MPALYPYSPDVADALVRAAVLFLSHPNFSEGAFFHMSQGPAKGECLVGHINRDPEARWVTDQRTGTVVARLEAWPKVAVEPASTPVSPAFAITDRVEHIAAEQPRGRGRVIRIDGAGWYAVEFEGIRHHIEVHGSRLRRVTDAPTAPHVPVYDKLTHIGPTTTLNDFQLFAGPASPPPASAGGSRLSEAMTIIEEECGAFVFIGRLGDRDEHTPDNDGETKREYATIVVVTDADQERGHRQLRRAVLQWLARE